MSPASGGPLVYIPGMGETSPWLIFMMSNEMCPLMKAYWLFVVLTFPIPMTSSSSDILSWLGSPLFLLQEILSGFYLGQLERMT